jgi:hypothetical protein
MIGNLLPTRTCCALLVGGAALLGACTVDPYTGAIVPCCGPGYAGYPAGSPGGGPGYAGYPAGSPDGGAGPQGPGGMSQGGEGWSGPGPQGGMEYSGGGGQGGHGHLRQRFAAANVTQDGRLTLQQAQAANWRRVAKNFYDIDVQHKGFVTVDDIRSWRAAHKGGQGGGGQGGGGYGYGGGGGFAGQGGGYQGGGYPGQGGGYPGQGGGYPGPGGGYPDQGDGPEMDN